MKPYQLKILATKRRAGYNNNVIAVGMVSEMLWIKQGRRGRPKGFSPKAAGYIQQIRYVNGRKVVVYVKPDTGEPSKKQRPQKTSIPPTAKRYKQAKKAVEWLKQHIPPLSYHKKLLRAIEEGMTHPDPQSIVESYHQQPPPNLEPETVARWFGLFVGATLALKPELLKMQGKDKEKAHQFCEALTDAIMPAPSRTWDIYITTDWRSILTSEQFRFFLEAIHKIRTDVVSRIRTNETKLPYIEALPSIMAVGGHYNPLTNSVGINVREVTNPLYNRTVAVLIHEFGHWVEFTKRLVYVSREYQEAAERKALTLADDWCNTHKGNYAYTAHYMTIGDTPVLGATEVLSSGLTSFFLNKREFFLCAPVHFAYVHLAVTHADLPFK